MARKSMGPSGPGAFSARELSLADSKAYLIERVITLLDRTFAEQGRGEGLRVVREILLGLDQAMLRDLVHTFGIEAPEELEEPERENRD